MSEGGGEGGVEGRLREGADGIPGGDVNFWWSQPPWLAVPSRVLSCTGPGWGKKECRSLFHLEKRLAGKRV